MKYLTVLIFAMLWFAGCDKEDESNCSDCDSFVGKRWNVNIDDGPADCVSIEDTRFNSDGTVDVWVRYEKENGTSDNQMINDAAKWSKTNNSPCRYQVFDLNNYPIIPDCDFALSIGIVSELVNDNPDGYTFTVSDLNCNVWDSGVFLFTSN